MVETLTGSNQPLSNMGDTSSLQQAIARLQSRLRPGQQRMADWEGGPLAVSAVPGSGKSTGMAIAAAILLAKRHQQHSSAQGQLILVTFTRSAVANLKTKVRQYLRELSLPSTGFAVHTLHGLALNIATRHPELSGLNLDRLTLVSPNQSHRLIRTCVEQWMAANPRAYQQLLEGRQFDGEETERLRRQSVLRTEVLPDLAYTVIHEAKSSGLQPSDLLKLSQEGNIRVATSGVDYNVLAIAAGLYQQYQALLRLRGFIDYDDMILAALRVLEDEPTQRLWQTHAFAVFEDEAQDSSPLQTKLLEILAADPANPQQLNLVRVGDPNQAINSTFTPADPIFFREFCEACQTQNQLAEMDQAGRSSQIIIDAANFLLNWVNHRYRHPIPNSKPNQNQQADASTPFPSSAVLSLPFRTQYIHPVGVNDPQADANPTPEGEGVELRFPRDIYHTAELMGRRVVDVLTRHPERRAAVLVRENRQGKFLSDVLRYPDQFGIEVNLSEHGIQIYDVGERDRHSHVPAETLAMLQFLDRPHSPDNLKAALKVLVDRQLVPTQDLNALASLPEQFLYPGPLDPPQTEPVQRARRYCTSLLRAHLELPHYQLIPFLALTLKYDQSELATADKLAARMAQQTAASPSMAASLEALSEIVRSERFEPVETDDPEARYTRPGQLTIITMHKAKGLDWDYVFIPFLHEHVLPGSLWVPPQTQFLGEFTLAEVARAQIRASIHHEFPLPNTEDAWQRAGYLKTAEEFRLLYVAMTRAKRLLWMSAASKAPFTWSKPDNLDERAISPALLALRQQFLQPAFRPSR